MHLLWYTRFFVYPTNCNQLAISEPNKTYLLSKNSVLLSSTSTIIASCSSPQFSSPQTFFSIV